MTSNPPAQPRPPPSISSAVEPSRQSNFSSLSLSRRASFPSIPSQHGSNDLPATTDFDDRPPKRRRVESHGSSPATELQPNTRDDRPQQTDATVLKKYISVDWVSALSGLAKKPQRDDIHKSASPLPIPPWNSGQATPELQVGRTRTSCRYRANVVVPNTPDSIHCPSDAAILENRKPADYFPWIGKHPEDIINDKNVNKGYWDHAPQPAERELNTAKAPLYNAFKHRAGLESLSLLFSLVLDQKSKHGALSSSTSFRPPPRVTLTEAKRRSWIADLADGDVPLRRLSRTIPQGIRGVSLLEQCQSYNVPVNRAIWFVKCVGANEIRTLKRKGLSHNVTVGAETKWLRDWTTNVEQFLEACIVQCGSEQWRETLKYRLHLCTRLYHESLLDRDHFLDWLVKGLVGCSLELLGTWLILFQMFKSDLMRFRKRATHIAAAFLTRFKELCSLNSSATALGDRMKSAIHMMANLRPACFLMPEKWHGSRDVLRSCFDMNDIRYQRVFDHIERRNLRMLGSSADGTTEIDKVVFEILDDTNAPYSVNGLSDSLLVVSTNHSYLSNLCVKWATSKLRGGQSRIYLVARLLRRWQRVGIGIDDALLNFFSKQQDTSVLNLKSYRHLFAQLSRTKGFSSSRFLQILSLTNTAATSQASGNVHHPSFLLRDLCLGESEEHMVNLRNNLLKKQPAVELSETRKIPEMLNNIEQALLAAGAENLDSHLETSILEDMKQLDWSSRFQISGWLRIEASNMSKLALVEVPGKPPLPGSKVLTASQFRLFRDILEASEDTAVLADVIHILSNTRQEPILASMIDTINCHALALSAIGALEPLQKLFGGIYVALRATRPSMLLLATSLWDLCQQFPSTTTPVRALQQDLMRGDRGRPLAACSPFSDGVAESLQQAGATFTDDFEAILQGEPNMTEQKMTSLFTVLIGRIMKSDSETHGQNIFALCQLLARLRLFRPTQGDLLIRKWLTRLFTAAWSPVHQTIIIELLYTRCVSLDSVIEIATQAPPASKSKEALRDFILAGMVSRPIITDCPQHGYIAMVASKRFVATNPDRILELLSGYDSCSPELLDTCASILPKFLSSKAKSTTMSPVASATLTDIVNQLLPTSYDQESGLAKSLSQIDWLSFPYFRYRIPAIGTAMGVLDEAELERTTVDIFEGLRLNVKSSDIHPEITQMFLESMPSNIQERIRTMTEQQFYDTLPKFFHSRTISQPLQVTIEEKQRSLQAVTKLVSLGQVSSNMTSGDSNGILIEKLTIVAKALGSKTEMTSTNSISTTNAPSPISTAHHAHNNAFAAPFWDDRYRESVLAIVDYLNMFLKIASTKTGLFKLPAGTGMSKAMQNEQIKLLAFLARIATQPSLLQLLQSNLEDFSKEKARSCISFALDVSARLADDLSDEARVLCMRILKDSLRDDRIQWLVGSMNTCAAVNNTAGQGLVMMHDTRGAIGDFRPKQWEMLESGGGKDGDACLGLGLFGAKRV